MVTTKEHRVFGRSFSQTDSSNDDDVIRGVSLITEGVAKGHNCSIDGQTLSGLLEASKRFKNGVRANLGHFTGVENAFGFINNLRIAGQKLIGDLNLFREHKDYSLIKRQIGTIADTIGFSVFFDGPDEEIEQEVNGAKIKIPFARCHELFSCDLVGEAACNPSGVFERKFISGPTARGQIDDSTVDTKKEVMATDTKETPDLKTLIKETMDECMKAHSEHMDEISGKVDKLCAKAEAIGTNDTPVKNDDGAAELQYKEGKEKDSSPGNPGGSAMDDDKEKDTKKDMSAKTTTATALSAADRTAIASDVTNALLKTFAAQKISPPATATAASATDGAANGNGKHAFKTFHEACRHSLSEITGSATPKTDAMKLAAEKYPELYKAYEMGQRNGESWTREALFSTPEKKQRNLSIIASGRLL